MKWVLQLVDSSLIAKKKLLSFNLKKEMNGHFIFHAFSWPPFARAHNALWLTVDETGMDSWRSEFFFKL